MDPTSSAFETVFRKLLVESIVPVLENRTRLLPALNDGREICGL